MTEYSGGVTAVASARIAPVTKAASGRITKATAVIFGVTAVASARTASVTVVISKATAVISARIDPFFKAKSPQIVRVTAVTPVGRNGGGSASQEFRGRRGARAVSSRRQKMPRRCANTPGHGRHLQAR